MDSQPQNIVSVCKQKQAKNSFVELFSCVFAVTVIVGTAVYVFLGADYHQLVILNYPIDSSNTTCLQLANESYPYLYFTLLPDNDNILQLQQYCVRSCPSIKTNYTVLTSNRVTLYSYSGEDEQPNVRLGGICFSSGKKTMLQKAGINDLDHKNNILNIYDSVMLAWTIGIVGAFVGTCLWLGLPGRVGIIVGYGTAGIMVGTMLCYCLFKWIQQDYVGYQILIVIFTVGLFWLILLVFCRANFELQTQLLCKSKSVITLSTFCRYLFCPTIIFILCITVLICYTLLQYLCLVSSQTLTADKFYYKTIPNIWKYILLFGQIILIKNILWELCTIFMICRQILCYIWWGTNCTIKYV